MAKRQPKSVRNAGTGVATPAFSLTVPTLQLAHEALVQMRAGNAQIMAAKANAMNELETVLVIAGQQTQQQQAEAAAAAQAAEKEAVAAPAAPVKKAARKRR